jgi:hypothetical protein
MSEKPNQPREYDAVLGGQAPTPVDGVVLGRLEGVKLRLASAVVEAQVTAALKEALKYGDAGLDLVIGAINHADRQVQRSAYLLLRERAEPQVKQALKQYKLWNGFERLYGLPCGHATIFTNRKVENFDPISGITDPVGTAYALRVSNGYYVYGGIEENIADKLELLLQDPKASKIEALVFGVWEYSYDSSKVVVDALVAAHEYLTSLQAVFIGDIEDLENMISCIQQSDISPILSVYPNLEVLKVRGGTNLAFSPVRHNKLEALCIETGGLSRETVAQICALGLPSLEYLELWLGSRAYDGDSTIDDVMPIISGESFPKLKYLGLRNSEYSDDIALALVRSPLLERLIELDLSMGTLGDEGAEALLNCPAINRLDTLNVAQNYLSRNTIEPLSQLSCQVIADKQRGGYSYPTDVEHRYCSVAE